jgi:hypothetical protein
MRAIPWMMILDDLEGFMRDAIKPDIGCYEFKE